MEHSEDDKTHSRLVAVNMPSAGMIFLLLLVCLSFAQPVFQDGPIQTLNTASRLRSHALVGLECFFSDRDQRDGRAPV